MFKRNLESILRQYATFYPVIAVTGPRQSGKTTLVKEVFAHLPYVLLENLDIRERAQQDPQSFLKFYEKTGAIFDEIQYIPELLSYLQGVVDASKETGRFVITGSQNFLLNQHITQSLAGRVGMLTLLPLSIAELTQSAIFKKNETKEMILNGGYPRLYEEQIPPIHFFPSYINTYIERDVRTLLKVENLVAFRGFLKLCAGRVGQLINFSSLAQDAGISHTTARQWLTILEASYIIFLLQPYHKNFSKRLIKSPKLYFYDSGLAASLLELENSTQLYNHYLRGALYENLIIVEVMKARMNQGLPASLYFWRDQTGHEIDLITEWGGTLKAIEIKSGMTFHPDFIKNIIFFSNLAADQTIEKFLVFEGDKGLFKETALINVDDIEGIIKS